jgi:hypothetical protein
MSKMLKKSKYAVGVQTLRQFSDSELREYVRKGAKAVNQKARDYRKALDEQEQNFSEFLTDYEEVSGMLGGISGATKGKTRQQLLQIAYAINRLSEITESPKQVKHEMKVTIRDIFKEPRVTQLILDKLLDKQIIQIGRDNIDFITNTLGSPRINELAKYHDEETAEFYKQLITEVSDELDKYDEKAKLQELQEWTFPENEEEYNKMINPDWE